MDLPVHPWLVVERAPLLGTVFPGAATDEETRAYCDALHALYSGLSHPVAWVLDASAVRTVPASQRAIFANNEVRTRAAAVQWNRGTAFIVTNAFVRGVLSAVYWASPPAYPYKIFSHRQDAEAWAMAQLGR